MYHEKILKYLYYSIKDIEDAKDLTQEVFSIVYNRMNEVQHHENISGFIYQTAKYTALNFKRKTAKKLQHEHPITQDSAAPFSDIHAQLSAYYNEKVDESQYISTVMTQLSPDKQMLYKLHYIDNKTYKEIAKHLNIGEASLRMKYVRLRREIKHIIKVIAKNHFPQDVTNT